MASCVATLGSSSAAHRLSVTGEDGSQVGELRFGALDHVADAAYAFVRQHALRAGVADTLWRAVCEESRAVALSDSDTRRPLCSRRAAVLYENSVLAPDASGDALGVLRVWAGQRPEDAAATPQRPIHAARSALHFDKRSWRRVCRELETFFFFISLSSHAYARESPAGLSSDTLSCRDHAQRPL